MKKTYVISVILFAVCLFIFRTVLAEDNVNFTDPVFETKVRMQLSRPSGAITQAECLGIKNLYLSNMDVTSDESDTLPDIQKIHDLSDLQYFPNLIQLDFGNNAVENIAPLAALTQLTYLEAPMNQIRDLRPIGNLTKLVHAVFWSNQIVDISPVENLRALKVFSIASNQVSDISPLANLDRLEILEIQNNPITDYSTIASLYPGIEETGIYEEATVADDQESVQPDEQPDACAEVQTSIQEKTEDDTSALQIRVLGSVGGQTNAVAAAGQVVYIGKGTAIVVLRNSDGVLRQTDESISLDSFVTDLEVNDGILFAAAGSAGVYLVDISNPQALTIAGRYTSDGFAEAVAVRDQRLYIADGENGLEIVDVVKPDAPALLSRTYNGKYAYDVKLTGNYACIAAANDGLLIADLSTENQPSEISAYDTKGVARSVFIQGSLAFIADDWQGVCVIDMQDPYHPVLVAQLNTAGRAYDLAMNDHMLYIADAFMGIRALNIETLTSPLDIASYIPVDSQATKVCLYGDMLYAADQTNGLLCFDISNTDDLALESLYANAIPLPLAMPDELQVFSNSGRIARLGILGILGNEEIRANERMTRREYAVILCRAAGLCDSSVKARVVFSDVPDTDPDFAAITLVAEYGIMDAVQDDRFEPDAYMAYTDVAACLLKLVHRFPKDTIEADSILRAGEEIGLEAAYSGETVENCIQRGDAIAMLEKTVSEIPDSLTNQTLLQETGITLEAVQSVAFDCVVWDGYMALPAGYAGVCILDIHNPQNIRQIAHLSENGFVKLVKISGDYAYAFTSDDIITINVKNPYYPYTVSVTNFGDTGGPPRNAVIEDQRIYIADEWGIRIYSIEDPESPVLVKQQTLMSDTLAISSCTSDLAVREGIAYVAFENRGIEIYDLRDAGNIRKIGSYTYDSIWISNVQFFGDYAIVKTPNGSELLDIRDIENPVKVGSIQDQNSTQYNYNVGFYRQYALLPDDTNGVMIVDLSEMTNPVCLAWIDTPGIPVSVKIDGDTAYVMDGVGGIVILDLAAEVETVNPSGSTDGIYQNSWYQGASVAQSSLSGAAALKAVQAERERMEYTQTLIVSNTASDGAGSLLWCVEQVPAGGRILFNTDIFQPSEPGVIYLTQALILNADHVTIDASNAGVILDGSNAPGDCLDLCSENNVIRGLQIQNFPSASISISGAGNIIGGDRNIGSGPNGEGNVLIRCGLFNMNGSNVTDNILVGNNIGVEADGVTPAGNTDGIQLRKYASRNVIGIYQAGYGNIISNNGANGISSMEYAYNNLIEGNYIGTDITGTLAQGNGRHGICFELGLGSVVYNNVVDDSGKCGVLISDAMSNYNVLLGNRLGMAANSETVLNNHGGNVFLLGGYGGIVTGNVLGDREDALQNKIAPMQVNNALEIGEMVYNTILNGEVYHYMDTQ